MRGAEDGMSGNLAGAATVGDLDPDFESSLRIILGRITRRFRTEGSEGAPGLSQLSALATLWRHKTLSPTALAEIERVQPPSMTRIIAALEERGYVIREPHPTDRRQVVIEITPKGLALIEQDRSRRQAWLTGALAALTPEERAQLRSVIPIFERLLDQ
jgi:DNA-binding MarR family transcriptional regulator